MDPNTLKNSGLLEQYVLGLTSRKENELVEACLEESPEARAELEALRQEFNAYAEASGMAPPADGRPRRTHEEFEDLDHEMILEMMERNHTLSIWRYVLGAVTLLLIGLAGFLFRQNQNIANELIHEKAEHAQDEHANNLKWREVQEHAQELPVIETGADVATIGPILLHRLPEQQLLLLDLSHVEPLAQGQAYYVFAVGNDKSAPLLTVGSTTLKTLHPITLDAAVAGLQVYRYEAGHQTLAGIGQADLVADVTVAQ